MLLVRHGQSEWNALGRWQGRADPSLTDVGRRQAKKATGHLSGFDAVVASPLCRAFETATILAETLGIGPVLADADLVVSANVLTQLPLFPMGWVEEKGQGWHLVQFVARKHFYQCTINP